MINSADMEKLYTHCLRCGKKLRNVNTRIRGYGNVCYKKMQLEKGKRLFVSKKEHP